MKQIQIPEELFMQLIKYHAGITAKDKRRSGK